ncbi:EpsD family peptidyl-prolyl cis-trans isomerase [Duganella sp. sic0402]|uniref:EpsD family peptidyl-prolyl cis-trans isomerase n=1 Tax=Duganella sp. sic0402 TaxID=2854786 RepID=UPI001C450C84|nr:EpsD family peptidyl-prolyl cis-trans isomerase [Duganella sp. sic0402]MBV7535978.1 EpsD family peptidyl-prolyl cis-trans isomerase [Duganella sp. sic0402]
MSRKTSRVACAAWLLIAVVGLSACGDKTKKPGQSLASVNGNEITVLQLNEELQRAGVAPAQQEAASKQLLEALIDRQLLQEQAEKDKTDRDPKVVQAIERAKSLILAQAYIQKRIGNVGKPTRAEVEEYFQKNPGFFTNRKQFDMRQLVLASRDVDAPLKAAMDSAKSLEEVAAWLDAHKVRYARAQLTRATTDLPPELSGKLLAMPKGQLFIIKEGERSLLITIADIKDTPVTLEAATPQIEQFLINKRTKDATDAEIKRLRGAAKIEYLNKAATPAAAAATASAPAAAAPAPAAATPAPAAPAAAASTPSEAINRGVAGMK